MMKKVLFALTALSMLGISTTAHAVVTVVNQFLPNTPTPTVGQWYLTDVRSNGTASIPDLTGQGGNLEFNQPLPSGAALLTTGIPVPADGTDKAEVGTFDDYGVASTVLNNINLGYSYYRTNLSGGNTVAAPSLKIAVFSATGTGTGNNDSFGFLIYEPYVNPISTPPSGSWQNVSIDQTTGTGSTSGDGWWWSGGFGIGSSFGGPAYRSLSEWVTAFQSGTDAADFATAHVTSFSVGVGSVNPGVTGYFDAVSIAIPGGTNVVYDFQAVPEPTTWGLITLGLVGIGYVTRHRKKIENR
jgi:hypothetical protein